jgi:hypothetical protein
VQVGSELTVLEVKLILAGTDTRLGVRQRLVAEAMLGVVVVEIVGVLKWTRYWSCWIYFTHIHDNSGMIRR